MSKVVLEIPDSILAALGVTPEQIEPELRKELAIALYQRGVLSVGKARELSGLTRWEFEDLLGERQVIRHYTQHDLDEDMRYARGG